MGSGLWAGQSSRQDLEGRLVGSKGATLMVNHGLIASANVSKLNIWGWLLPAKLTYGVIRSIQKATFMQKICTCNICILYVIYSSNMYCVMCVLCMQYYALLLYEIHIKRMHIIKIIPLEVPLLKRN